MREMSKRSEEKRREEKRCVYVLHLRLLLCRKRLLDGGTAEDEEGEKEDDKDEDKDGEEEEDEEEEDDEDEGMSGFDPTAPFGLFCCRIFSLISLRLTTMSSCAAS